MAQEAAYDWRAMDRVQGVQMTDFTHLFPFTPEHIRKFQSIGQSDRLAGDELKRQYAALQSVIGELGKVKFNEPQQRQATQSETIGLVLGDALKNIIDQRPYFQRERGPGLLGEFNALNEQDRQRLVEAEGRRVQDETRRLMAGVQAKQAGVEGAKTDYDIAYREVSQFRQAGRERKQDLLNQIQEDRRQYESDRQFGLQQKEAGFREQEFGFRKEEHEYGKTRRPIKEEMDAAGLETAKANASKAKFEADPDRMKRQEELDNQVKRAQMSAVYRRESSSFGGMDAPTYFGQTQQQLKGYEETFNSINQELSTLNYTTPLDWEGDGSYSMKLGDREVTVSKDDKGKFIVDIGGKTVLMSAVELGNHKRNLIKRKADASLSGLPIRAQRAMYGLDPELLSRAMSRYPELDPESAVRFTVMDSMAYWDYIKKNGTSVGWKWDGSKYSGRQKQN